MPVLWTRIISKAKALKWKKLMEEMERKPFDIHRREYEEALQYLKENQ